MLFTSFNFLIFLSLVAAVYYLLPYRLRVPFLLAISYVFYGMLQPAFLLLLIVVTLVGYWGGIGLEEIPREKSRGMLLAIVIGLLVIVLLFFKYYDFIVANLNWVCRYLGNTELLHQMHWLQPVGISFFTFQTFGYVMDVYRKKYPAERMFIDFALYVAFFPIIQSGPIERGDHLLPQFHTDVRFDYDGIIQGMKKMFCGYFMKLVIAERIFNYLGYYFEAPQFCSSATLWFSMLLYPIGLYADFAGYSLIAIGVAKVLGINVNGNFERPFLAENIPGFWRRWHISLTSWMTDYVHTPLTIFLRDYGIPGIALASFVVFLLVGVWHGASWNYILFGCVHGIYVAISVLKQKKLKKFEKRHSLKNNRLYHLANGLGTYLLVSLAFVLFRCESLAKTAIFYSRLAGAAGHLDMGMSTVQFAFMFFFALGLLAIELLQEKYSMKFMDSPNIAFRWGCCIVLCLGLLLFGCFGNSTFVYLQF